MKALVVDDDSIIRKYIMRALKEEADITEAADQQAAKRLFKKGLFDVALVDVNLGPDNGIGLAIWLRDIDPRLVIVVMSGDHTNEDKVRQVGLGEMLKKPFTLDDLRQRLI